MLRLVLSLAAFFFLYLISGERTFDSSAKTTGYVVRYLLLALILPVITAASVLISGFTGSSEIRGDWPLELFLTLLLYLFVGIFEETTFRAIVNDGMLIRFRKVKGIFVIIAVVSSLIFGAVHVIGVDVSDPAVILPAVMKTLSTGLAGLCYLFMYWKTRNLWGIAIVHGLYDFLSSLSEALFVSDASEIANGAARYASASDAGIEVVIYSIQVVLNLVVVLFLWFKVVRKIDFEELRNNW